VIYHALFREKEHVRISDAGAATIDELVRSDGLVCVHFDDNTHALVRGTSLRRIAETDAAAEVADGLEHALGIEPGTVLMAREVALTIWGGDILTDAPEKSDSVARVKDLSRHIGSNTDRHRIPVQAD